MIEDLMTKLIASLDANTATTAENTAALRDVLAASSNAAPAPAAEPAKRTRAKAAPAPESPAPAPAPATDDQPEVTTPATDDQPEVTTPVPTKATKGDTPHVPAPTTPGQPAAGEFVDVDEVIAEIQTVVKEKLFNGDTEVVKAKWETIRKGYGVDRISELRGEPAKLVEALAKAKSL